MRPDSMSNSSKEFLERTITVWQQYTHESLSLKVAQGIANNMTGFLALLSEWEEKDGRGTERCNPNRTKTKQRIRTKRRDNERTSLLDMQENTRGG